MFFPASAPINWSITKIVAKITPTNTEAKAPFKCNFFTYNSKKYGRENRYNQISCNGLEIFI